MNKNTDKTKFSKIKNKVFNQMLLIIFTAIVTIIFLRYLFQGHLGDSIVNFFENTFFLTHEDGQNLYQHLIRNNLTDIIILTIVGFIIILLKFGISWFTKYFDEISDGMDKLVEESDKDIILSPELDFMEKKLNDIKNKLEKQKKAAQDAEQRKNDLVVYLAHDIKTPLTSVIGYLSLLDEAKDMPLEQKSKYIGITLEKAYRLEQLINEFFDITRFNLESIVLNKEKINLIFMLQQMADEFFPMLEPKGMKVLVNAEEDITLDGDADKLARVFNNILKNAIAYSFKDSTIEILAEKHDENVVISFKSKGRPIPKSKLDVIFERFYRLDTARSSNTGGAGLGLAIAKEIVLAHGGNIYAESDKNFTVFTISLPAETYEKE